MLVFNCGYYEMTLQLYCATAPRKLTCNN